MDACMLPCCVHARGLQPGVVGFCVVLRGVLPQWVQCLRHADTAYYMGVLDVRQRVEALQRQLEVASLILAGTASPSSSN